MHLEMNSHGQDGELLPVALWCPGPGYRMISSGLTGGGIGPREWVLNAQVPAGYSRMDPAVHIAELAADFGLKGEGVGVLAAATVGLRVPTWAAVPPGPADRELAPVWRPGTINIIVSVPVPLRDAAYVNAVMTATEAKTQALLDAGFRATGTASDAICVAAPAAGEPEDFAGPRALWGARIARAVHSAVHAGAVRYPADPA